MIIKYLLKRSFTRRGLRHLTFFIILTCVMMIPLFQIIFISGEMEGQRQYIQATTKGAAFQLKNASEDDLPIFDGLENLKASYDEGSIWFSFDELSWEPSETFVEKTGRYLQATVEKAGYDQSSLTNIYYIGKDESYIHGYDDQKLFGFFLLCLSVLFVFLSCNSHMRLFITDIRQLQSIGATKQHIRLFFLWEYLLISIGAGIFALGLSLTVMRVLYSMHLETSSQILAWNVFHIDVVQLMLPVLLLITVGSVFVCLRANVYATSTKINVRKPPSNRRFKIAAKNCQPVSYLISIFKYENRTLKECFSILLIVIILSVLVVNALEINYYYVNEKPVYDILLSTPSFDDGLDSDVISELSRLSDVEKIKSEPLIHPTDYIILDNRLKGVSEQQWDDMGYTLTWIHNARRAFPEISNQLEDNQVIVTGNYKYLPYKKGDTILLQATGKQYDFSSTLKLDVVSVVDLPENNRAVDLFFSDSLYEKLTRDLPIGEIYIKLKRSGESAEFVRRLTERYPDYSDQIIDFYTPYLESYRIFIGQTVMYLVTLLLVLICICIIVIAKISEYLQEQKHTQEVLFNVGVSNEMLKKAYFLQMIKAFLATSVIALIIAYSILLVSLSRTGNNISFTWVGIVAQVIVLGLMALSYLLPVVLFPTDKQQRRKIV